MSGRNGIFLLSICIDGDKKNKLFCDVASPIKTDELQSMILHVHTAKWQGLIDKLFPFAKTKDEREIIAFLKSETVDLEYIDQRPTGGKFNRVVIYIPENKEAISIQRSKSITGAIVINFKQTEVYDYTEIANKELL